MIGDLEAFLEGRPVSARPAGFGYFAWRFAHRHRYAVAASTVAVLAFAIAGGAALWESRIAAEHAERAAREAEIRNVTRAMLTDLLRVGPASAVSEQPHSALEALDQGTQRTLSALGSNLQHRAIAASVLAESYLDLDHPQRARSLIEQTLPMLDRVNALDPDRLQLNLLLARADAELGDSVNSRLILANAESTLRRLDIPRDASSQLAAALVRVQLDRHEGHQERARDTAMQLLRDSDHPTLNQSLEFANLLRSVAMQSYDDAFAIRSFERAWKITAAHYGEDSPAALSDQRTLIARDLHGPHRLDTDRLLASQEDRIKDAFGDQSLDYADVLSIRCEQSEEAKLHADAAACWRRVLPIYEQAPDSDVLLAIAYDNIAANLLKAGKPAEALPFYEREFAARSRNFSPANQNVIHSRLQIAKTRCLAGDVDEATREFDAAIVDYVASVGPNHPYEAVYAAYFATCLLDAGRIESARSIMASHGQLEPPRKEMTEEDRADVAAVWKRLSH